MGGGGYNVSKFQLGKNGETSLGRTPLGRMSIPGTSLGRRSKKYFTRAVV